MAEGSGARTERAGREPAGAASTSSTSAAALRDSPGRSFGAPSLVNGSDAREAEAGRVGGRLITSMEVGRGNHQRTLGVRE